jgi:excisionase family DNA binding protein
METQQPSVADESDFLTVKQAARHLNVSPSCVYRLCTANKLTHYKFGDGQGAVRVRRADLLDMIQGCRIEKEKNEAGTGRVRKPVKPSGYVFKHLFVREKHACGAPTRAGTPCTRWTRDERCRQHRG